MPKRRGTSKSNGRKDAYDRFYTKGDEANRLVRYAGNEQRLWNKNHKM